MAETGITFDFRYIEGALELVESSATVGSAQFARLARLPAIDHILRHMDRFGIGALPGREELVRQLLGALDQARELVPGIRWALAEAHRCDDARESWLRPLKALLPREFQFRNATLYLTFGYDIGVVSDARSASLNLAHRFLREHSHDLRYYLVHELHHVAYLNYHQLGRIRDLSSRAELAGLVQGLTHLEGLGTYAPWDERRAAGAIVADPDYVALETEELMQGLEQRFWELSEGLDELPPKLGLEQGLPVIESFGSPRKLFHLVGARLARRIAESLGHAALVQTVVDGPGAFMELARKSRQ